MSTQPTPTKTRTKRQSAYVANIKVIIPLTDAAGLVDAMKAIENLMGGLPANATVTVSADVGKV